MKAGAALYYLREVRNMMTRIHMQDQVHNRIEELMKENEPIAKEKLFQDTATLAIVTVFLLLGLSW